MKRNPRWLLTFSHTYNSWMACNLGAIPWVPVQPRLTALLYDWGYTLLDAI